MQQLAHPPTIGSVNLPSINNLSENSDYGNDISLISPMYYTPESNLALWNTEQEIIFKQFFGS